MARWRQSLAQYRCAETAAGAGSATCQPQTHSHRNGREWNGASKIISLVRRES